jgi:hypothetical protein
VTNNQPWKSEFSFATTFALQWRCPGSFVFTNTIDGKRGGFSARWSSGCRRRGNLPQRGGPFFKKFGRRFTIL